MENITVEITTPVEEPRQIQRSIRGIPGNKNTVQSYQEKWPCRKPKKAERDTKPCDKPSFQTY